MQTDITSKGLRDSEEERGSPQMFMFLCHGIVVIAAHLSENKCRHYTGMMKHGLLIAVTIGGWGRGNPSHTHPHPHTNPNDWSVG